MCMKRSGVVESAIVRNVVRLLFYSAFLPVLLAAWNHSWASTQCCYFHSKQQSFIPKTCSAVSTLLKCFFYCKCASVWMSKIIITQNRIITAKRDEKLNATPSLNCTICCLIIIGTLHLTGNLQQYIFRSLHKWCLETKCNLKYQCDTLSQP